MADFQDPGQEWRRFFLSCWGLSYLVLVAAGGGMMSQAFPGTISRTAAVVAPGMMVMAIILFMGKVSGAHLNPAVSLAFALRGDFQWASCSGLHRCATRWRSFGCLVSPGGNTRVGDFRCELSGVRGYSAADAYWMEAILTFWVL